MNVINIASEKMCSGKTTIVIGLANFLANTRNKKVLIVDLTFNGDASTILRTNESPKSDQHKLWFEKNALPEKLAETIEDTKFSNIKLVSFFDDLNKKKETINKLDYGNEKVLIRQQIDTEIGEYSFEKYPFFEIDSNLSFKDQINAVMREEIGWGAFDYVIFDYDFLLSDNIKKYLFLAATDFINLTDATDWNIKNLNKTSDAFMRAMFSGRDKTDENNFRGRHNAVLLVDRVQVVNHDANIAALEEQLGKVFMETVIEFRETKLEDMIDEKYAKEDEANPIYRFYQELSNISEI